MKNDPQIKTDGKTNRHGVKIEPPVRTNEQYEADKAKGVNRIGKPEFGIKPDGKPMG